MKYVHKFNIQQNTMAKITKETKDYNEPLKSDIYSHSQVQYWTEQYGHIK
jgi:hypothetical protein